MRRRRILAVASALAISALGLLFASPLWLGLPEPVFTSPVPTASPPPSGSAPRPAPASTPPAPAKPPAPVWMPIEPVSASRPPARPALPPTREMVAAAPPTEAAALPPPPRPVLSPPPTLWAQPAQPAEPSGGLGQTGSYVPPPPPPSPSIAERVKAAAQPAKVEFAVPVTMTMGTRYRASLEVLRDGATSRLPRDNVVIAERLKVLDKMRASIESTDLKIDRLGDEWQEILPGGRALWLWGVEPVRPGVAHLMVNIHHAALVDGSERRYLVDTFPRTVTIEVGWWGRVQIVAASAPGFLSNTLGLITSLTTLAGLGGGFLLWSRKRVGRATGRSMGSAIDSPG